MRILRSLRPALAAALLLVAACDEGESQDRAHGTTSESPGGDDSSLFGTYLAARFAEAQRDLTSAADFYAQALALDPTSADLRKGAFIALLSDGRFDEIVPLAHKIAAEDSKFPLSRLVLAIAAIRDGDYAAAEAEIAELPKLQLNEIVLPMARAWTIAGDGEYDAALEALRPLAGRQGFQTFHDLHAALIKDIAGNAKGAEESYLAALGDSERPPARLVQALASFYARHGRLAEAKELIARQYDGNGGSELLKEMHLKIQATGEVPPVATNAREGFAEALFDVASAFFREGSSRFGLVYGRLALMTSPDFPAAQMLLAEVLESQELYAQANKMLAQVGPESVFYWPAQTRIASNLNALGETDQAISKLEELAERRQNDSYPLIDMADILRSKERFEEAVKAYDRAMARVKEVKPHHWTVLYSRGIALERSKQWERAERDFLKALELEPEQPYVLNYLGYSWVERGENLGRAQEMIESAVSQRPNDGYIVDSLGWVLYRLGRFREAVEHLEKAVELKPQDPVINDHLGDAYWRVGRHHEARVQWNRALSLEPEKDLIPEIQAKLQRGLDPVAGSGDGPDQKEL